MIPYAHQAGVLQDKASRTPPCVLHPPFEGFVSNPLNFKRTVGMSPWFSACWPYLRAEQGKGLVHGPERYESIERASHQHRASVQLQQDNISSLISNHCSHWGLPKHVSCNRETQHHRVWFPMKMRAQKVLVMLEFSLR